MADARRLVEAAAGLHQHFAHALVLEPHPAFQHVDELHRDVVVVPFAVRRSSRPRADDMGHHLALRCTLDAEVAVLEVAAQAATLELGATAMIYAEVACSTMPSGHGASILG